MKKDVIRYESVLNESQELLNEMDELLKKFEANVDNYNELKMYYTSEEYFNDLEISSTTDEYNDINQGVLSEDGVFNLLGDMYNLNVRMIEVATNYLKTN